MAQAVKALGVLRPLDGSRIDEQRLLGGQHVAGHRQPLRIDEFVGLGLQGIDIGDVDVIRVCDSACLALIQRHVEVLGIDQRGQLLVHTVQER